MFLFPTCGNTPWLSFWCSARRVTAAADGYKLEQTFRYAHLSAEQRALVDAILKGKVPLDKLPQAESRVIRLFISSTFTGALQ